MRLIILAFIMTYGILAQAQDSCFVQENKFDLSFDLKFRFCKENSNGTWTDGADGPFIHFNNEKEQWVYLDFFLDSVKGRSFAEYYKSRHYYEHDLKIPLFQLKEYGDSAGFTCFKRHKYRRNGKIKSTYFGFILMVFHSQRIYYFWGFTDTEIELGVLFDDFSSRLEFLD